MSKNKHKKFNQDQCDSMYHIACATDTYCSDECDMKCPYEKKDKKKKKK